MIRAGSPGRSGRRKTRTTRHERMQHPELAVFCWSAAMLTVFAPLAVHLHRRQALS